MKKILLFVLIALAACSAFAEETEKEETKEKLTFWGKAAVYSFLAADKNYLHDFDNRAPHEFPLSGELELNAKYKHDEKIEANATVTIGNYLNRLEADPYEKRTAISAHLYYLNGKYKDDKFGELTLGSFGYQLHPFIFRRSSNESYFDNERMSCGDYAVTGGSYKNTFGRVDTEAWYGALGRNGFDDEKINAQSFLLGKVKNYYGARLGYDFSPVKLNAIYSVAASDVSDDKAKAFGGYVTAPLKFADFQADYFEQRTDNTDTSRIWDVKFSKSFGNLSTAVKYIYIGRNYNATGDWMYYSGNRNGARGFQFDLGYKFSDKFKANGYYQTGKDFEYGGDLMRTQWNFTYLLDRDNSLCFTWRNRHHKNTPSDNDNWFIFKYYHAFSEKLNFMLGFENYKPNRGGDKDQFGTLFTQLIYTF